MGRDGTGPQTREWFAPKHRTEGKDDENAGDSWTGRG